MDSMPAPKSPIGSRRRLGAELRRLRTAAGLTLDEVAARMTCSTSKISRLETGKGVPKVPDVSELMRIYGVASDTERDTLLRLVHDGREHGWWESYTDRVQPERRFLDSPSRYTALENDARTVRSFDLTTVHGLLQTEGYMRVVLRQWLVRHSPEEIDRLVAVRLRRQQAVWRAENPIVVFDVVDESVLWRPVGGPGVVAEQLRRLLEVSRLPNVTIRVLPAETGLLRAHVGHFVLLGIPPELGSDLVYVEGHAGNAYLDTQTDVELYDGVFADAVERSLDPDASAAMIDGYLSRHVPP
jgi:transcriptional regulator with XRE-family HTH domain